MDSDRETHRAADSDRDESLSDSFWRVARQLRHLSRETLAPWDISPSHSRAVAVLIRHGSMRLTELSDHLRIAPRSTTEVVDALESHGLIRREPDPHDRRATVVRLTDEGRRVGQAIRSARSAETERFFGALNATDQADLTRILRKLNDRS
jgi:DNA-binding MarR family transcriptional regulator